MNNTQQNVFSLRLNRMKHLHHGGDFSSLLLSRQSVSQKISSQEEPETLSRLGRVTVAMATVHRGRMKTGRVGTRSTERL